MGPGTLLTVIGTNFGSTSAGVTTCDCASVILSSWSNTKITGYVASVDPNPGVYSQGIQVENVGGTYSTAAPYTPIAAQVTQLVVGSCTWTPTSTQQCVITPGTQFTLYGNYFGAGGNSGPQINMCDCVQPTIQSWDSGWTSNPTVNNNVIVATANSAACGNSIQVWAEGIVPTMGSNPVPYTTCQ